MTSLHSSLAPRKRRSLQRGLSLIEVMVGMLIAMVGVVIMMEVLLSSEERTRTSTAGNDATSNGAIMLSMIQRDIAQSGYGLNTDRLLGCSVLLPTGATVPLAPVVINPPVALVPAGDANTDTLLVMYGNGSGQPEGNEVFGVNAATRTYDAQAPAAFAEGDLVLGVPAGCTAAIQFGVVQALGVNTVTTTARNPGGAATTPNSTALFNLGQTPRIVAYAIRNGALTTCDFMVSDCRVVNATNWTALAGGIVSLRAQYGRDEVTPSATAVEVDTWDQTTPTDACARSRTPAVRFALVARSGQYETAISGGQRTCQQVTTAAPLWAGSAGAPINLSGAADWQCYRYRTFEVIAPSRNVVWMGPQGCP